MSMPSPLPWQPGYRTAARAAFPTRHAALDAALADGGWPRGALGELLLPATGSGELPLALPALVPHVQAGGWLLLVDPPFLPCLPAWQAAGIDPSRLVTLHPCNARDWSWTTEQAARTTGCAVLAWQGRHALAMRELRRLQLAAQEGDALCLLLRPTTERAQPSPAALRLQLAVAGHGQTDILIVKQRGGFGGATVSLPLQAARLLPRMAAWQLPVHGARQAVAAGGTPAAACPREAATPWHDNRDTAGPAPAPAARH